jgi:hypothetical protein
MVEPLLFPNADKVSDLIEAEPDASVRSLMRLVHEELLKPVISGRRPEGSMDMLFCFTALQAAFRRKDALANALAGNYGDPSTEIEWV